MTTFLAIWGAVLSTILALFESVRFFLDRSRLRVRPEVTISVEGAWMRAVVVNRGRRPTTDTEAGFRVLAHHAATLPDGRQMDVQRWIKLDAPAVSDARPR